MAPRTAGKKVEPSDKVGLICRALRRAIIEQALEPGAKLPEDSLGERFGVSRTIARYALGQLAAEGLVELRRNRIAVVATPSWQEARDAFDIRIELERLVVRQLAGKLTKAQVAELNAHVDAEDRARDGSDAVSIRLATEFHILLANMTNSPILVRYVSEVAYRCCLTLSLYSRPHSSECAINEHRAIIAALVKGDVDKVMEAAIEAGADDVSSGESGHEVYASQESLHEVAKALEAKFGEPRKAALTWKPQNTIAVDDEAGEKLLKLIDLLNEHDDVQNVYANFEVSDALMAKMGG